MIGKVTRGTKVAGILYYLYGPGRKNEHRDPHLVAGWRDPADLEPAIRPNGRRDYRYLCSLLDQTVTALGPYNHDQPVWHCSLRAAPEDPILSDGQWAQISGEFMHGMGLAPYGDHGAVRWVAVRHADDHIHIVTTLAREDGTPPAKRVTGCASLRPGIVRRRKRRVGPRWRRRSGWAVPTRRRT